jgi:hypothetical protein
MPARRQRSTRGRRRLQRPRRRLLIALAIASVAAAAVIAAVLHVARPPTPVPFHFPATAAETPTAEIVPAERADLDRLLRDLSVTPSHVPPAHR